MFRSTPWSAPSYWVYAVTELYSNGKNWSSTCVNLPHVASLPLLPNGVEGRQLWGADPSYFTTTITGRCPGTETVYRTDKQNLFWRIHACTFPLCHHIHVLYCTLHASRRLASLVVFNYGVYHISMKSPITLLLCRNCRFCSFLLYYNSISSYIYVNLASV